MAQINPSSSVAVSAAPGAERGCTCFRLRRLTRRVTAVYDRALAAVGMRVTQYSVLAHVRRLRDVSMSDLADALDMDRTTLTRNLKPMLAAGWVEIEPSPGDARMRLVRITAAGEAQMLAARSHWRRAQEEVNTTIGPAQLAALHQMLDEYVPLFRPAIAGDSE